MNIDYKKYNEAASFAVKESIKANAREDKQQRIEKLWHLLITLHAHGEWNYSASAIGRKLEEHGIQKSQSYRNAQGKDYREIVDAFVADWGVKASHLPHKQTTPLEDAISSISDRDAQARIRMAITEVARLKSQNEQLRHQLRKMTDHISSKPAQVTPALNLIEPTKAASPKKPPIPVGSIKKFLEEDWMFGHGLHVDEHGVIYCEGQPITLPKFYDQLTALLSLAMASR